MKREIKFRAWSGDNNRMSPPENIFNLRGNTSFHFNGTEGSNAVLMQFTGLKDKNGVEIYEGDICESIGQRFVVGFKNGSFSAEYSDKSEDCFYLGNADENRFEVIGNFYQNPELID